MSRAGTKALLVLLWALLPGLPGRATAADWVVIVHPSREVAFELSDIAQIYLKQRRFWKDDAPIVPVNRSAGSLARESFARAVFQNGSRSLVTYWNRQYFRGVFPPISLASDEAVLRYVASEPRAIGYIPASLLDDTVRVAARFRSPDS